MASRQATNTGAKPVPAGAKEVASPTGAGATTRTKSSEQDHARLELAKQLIQAKWDREVKVVRKMFEGLSVQDLEKKVSEGVCVCVLPRRRIERRRLAARAALVRVYAPVW